MAKEQNKKSKKESLVVEPAVKPKENIVEETIKKPKLKVDKVFNQMTRTYEFKFRKEEE